ncbi:hypothetical protein [Amycolatopsis sp. ATCC 39116]|uniref:hypothetical protein n=1 Tax=Amycolatopsis sp. (strain ATCC 39116 / 75iv2) TaxID=385957 RepID=UPI00026255B5|nr:hypothetical protein [Amycolatopsis sp. ATCC 39116]
MRAVAAGRVRGSGAPVIGLGCAPVFHGEPGDGDGVALREAHRDVARTRLARDPQPPPPQEFGRDVRRAVLDVEAAAQPAREHHPPGHRPAVDLGGHRRGGDRGPRPGREQPHHVRDAGPPERGGRDGEQDRHRQHPRQGPADQDGRGAFERNPRGGDGRERDRAQAQTPLQRGPGQ